MRTNVEGLNVDVSIDQRFYITYNRHLISWNQFPLGNGQYSGVKLECVCCGQDAAANGGAFNERESWIVIMYLLDDFDYQCGSTLGEAVYSKMNDQISKYIGRPKDSSTIAELERDVQNALGGDVPVDVS